MARRPSTQVAGWALALPKPWEERGWSCDERDWDFRHRDTTDVRHCLIRLMEWFGVSIEYVVLSFCWQIPWSHWWVELRCVPSCFDCFRRRVHGSFWGEALSPGSSEWPASWVTQKVTSGQFRSRTEEALMYIC